MNTKEIIENNELIAEFMGSEYIDKSYKNDSGEYIEFWTWTKPKYCQYPKSIGIGELSTAWNIGNFHFHDSWDWLMLVVEKIESIGYKTRIIENRCCITRYSESADVCAKSKIMAVWLAVIEFIKWYNKNN